MKGFEIQINDKLVCAAGGPENSHIHVTAFSHHLEGQKFYVGGTIMVSEYRWDHLDWGKQQLKVGDKITISVVDRPKFDEPLEQHSSDPTKVPDLEEKLIKEMARYRTIAELEGLDAIKTPPSDTDFCSFCGKSKEEQPKMLKGPGDARICIECVSACNDIFISGGQWSRS